MDFSELCSRSLEKDGGQPFAVLQRGLVLPEKAPTVCGAGGRDPSDPPPCPVFPTGHSLLAIQKTAETTLPPKPKPEGPHHVLPTDVSRPENTLLPLTSAGMGDHLCPSGSRQPSATGLGSRELMGPQHSPPW